MNIVFDFGNVLVRWEPELMFTSFFGKDEAAYWYFWRHVCTLDWRNRIDAGEDIPACVAELQQSYPDYAEAIAMYDTRWEEALTGEVPGMRGLVQSLLDHGQHPVYGLTNWSMATFPKARLRFPILQLIENYIVSGDVHLVKPDPRIFQLLLDRFGLRADETLFIDDNEDNVIAATRLGFHGIHFTGADSLRNLLKNNYNIAI